MATPTNEFRIKLAPSTSYNFTVDWGDGISEIYNQTTSSTEDLAGLTHTYAAASAYEISIRENSSGGFPRIFFNGVTNTSSTNDDVKITDIVKWGNVKWTSMTDAFEGCLNLSAIETDNGISTLSGVSNFVSTWYNCSSIQTFPLIDTRNATNFNNTWYNCYSIKNFPLINTSKGTTFNFTWNTCESLSSFPLIDTSNATSFSYTWANCKSLTSFPLINTSKATSYIYTWFQCENLKDFPIINTLSAINLTRTWSYCTNLTSFPLIDTKNVTIFNATWTGSVSLSSSEFPTLNFSNMLTGTNCFNGVKLTTSSYSSILTSICATNFNNNVIFHGGNSTYNTPASAARRHLVNTKGWIITDGGYQIGT